MLIARIVIEFYKHFQAYLPTRLRLRMKHYIDNSHDAWRQIGILESPLQDTPYQLLLDMHHWHQRWTYVKGHYPEPHIAAILSHYLKDDDIYIDVGANIGVHVVYAAAKVGITGQVIAFEPNPHSYKRLTQQVALNQLKNVVSHHSALGNQTGTVILHDCHDENVGSTLRTGQSSTDNCEVPLHRAETFLADIPQDQAGLCKIDVEGYEYQVLLGMVDFIATHPQMAYIVEVTDEWLKAADSSAQILFDFFQDHAFQAHHIHPQNLNIAPLAKPLQEWQYDVLFKYNNS